MAEADPAAGFADCNSPRHGGDLRAEIDWPRFMSARDTRARLQQVIDERGHPLARGLDPLGVSAAGFAETVAVLLQQRFAAYPLSARSGARRSWETE